MEDILCKKADYAKQKEYQLSIIKTYHHRCAINEYLWTQTRLWQAQKLGLKLYPKDVEDVLQDGTINSLLLEAPFPFEMLSSFTLATANSSKFNS